jgi:hypothetical protein
LRRHTVRIVKSDQPLAVRVMQCERIAQPMWPLCRRLDPFDLKFQPIPLFEVVNQSVKPEQKFQCVFVRNGRLRSIYSYHVVIR